MVKFSRVVLAGAALLFFAYLAGAQQPEPVRITFIIESQPVEPAPAKPIAALQSARTRQMRSGTQNQL